MSKAKDFVTNKALSIHSWLSSVSYLKSEMIEYIFGQKPAADNEVGEITPESPPFSPELDDDVGEEITPESPPSSPELEVYLEAEAKIPSRPFKRSRNDDRASENKKIKLEKTNQPFPNFLISANKEKEASSDKLPQHKPSIDLLSPKKFETHLKPILTPSLKERLDEAYDRAEKENYKSPKGTRLATAKFLREFGLRIDDAIHKSSESGDKISIFEKLRKQAKEIGSRKPSFESGEDLDIHTFSFNFTENGASVTAHHKVYKSGITVLQVTGITSYEKIAEEFKKWACMVPNEVIASNIWEIMSDNKLTNISYLEAKAQEKYTKFLTKVCFLLFSAESAREPASLAVNSMFLDLVLSGKYKMSDIIKLPMSAVKAVPSTRTLSKKVLGDHNAASPVRADPKLRNKKVQNLLDNYDEILSTWLELYEGKEKLVISKDLRQISDLMTQKITDWFGIKIKPFRHSIEHELEALDYESSDHESLSCDGDNGSLPDIDDHPIFALLGEN